mmetsp:Transcript_36373/g.107378  ORF Transcript_36373/g.107378 Transcript_36373/m.107378 type:complete len:309 (+) Transcript_36373:809-1735(+)
MRTLRSTLPPRWECPSCLCVATTATPSPLPPTSSSEATVSRRVARLTECPLCASTATTRARCSTRSPRHDASPWTAAGRCWWRPCRTAAGTTRRRTTRPGIARRRRCARGVRATPWRASVRGCNRRAGGRTRGRPTCGAPHDRKCLLRWTRQSASPSRRCRPCSATCTTPARACRGTCRSSTTTRRSCCGSAPSCGRRACRCPLWPAGDEPVVGDHCSLTVSAACSRTVMIPQIPIPMGILYIYIDTYIYGRWWEGGKVCEWPWLVAQPVGGKARTSEWSRPWLIVQPRPERDTRPKDCISSFLISHT